MIDAWALLQQRKGKAGDGKGDKEANLEMGRDTPEGTPEANHEKKRKREDSKKQGSTASDFVAECRRREHVAMTNNGLYVGISWEDWGRKRRATNAM